jgi:hypothetical protein
LHGNMLLLMQPDSGVLFALKNRLFQLRLKVYLDRDP